jgi:hypothetical protein
MRAVKHGLAVVLLLALGGAPSVAQVSDDFIEGRLSSLYDLNEQLSPL